MLLCSACRQEKPEESFNLNRSSKRGRDCYCVDCRAAYYANGRTWPDAGERAATMLSKGAWKCSRCRLEKPLDQFYLSDSYRYGVSDYCKQCTSEKNKERWKNPEAKARRREYNTRPEVMARLRSQKEKTPRLSLRVRLSIALKRRPTDNPVTMNQLLEMWHRQAGCCAISGLKMTWGKGKTTPTSISIDRINPKLGYTLENVRLVCTQVNIFKGRWSDGEMVAMARAIAHKADQPAFLPFTFVA